LILQERMAGVGVNAKERVVMRKLLLTASVLGVLIGASVPLQATSLRLGPGDMAVQSDIDSSAVQIRRGGGGRGGMGMLGRSGSSMMWRTSRGHSGAAWRAHRGRGGAVWRGHRGHGVAWRHGHRRGGVWVGRPRWRVGWVGSGYYYNPAFYNRYYNPRWGYCRLVTWHGGRVCRWHRRPWW